MSQDLLALGGGGLEEGTRNLGKCLEWDIMVMLGGKNKQKS